MSDPKVAETPPQNVARKLEQPPAADPAKVNQAQALLPPRMKECEFERTLWVVTAHENTRPEDMLDPEYWTHVSERLRPFDKIEARADDGSWYAEFLVLDVSRRWATVHALRIDHLTTKDVSLSKVMSDEYTVEWKGPAHKHSVIRKTDGAVLHEGEQTKAGAYQWLSNRLKAGT